MQVVGSCLWPNSLIAGSRENKRVFSVSLFQVVTVDCTIFGNLIPLTFFMMENMLVSVMKGFAYNMLEKLDCFLGISLVFAAHPEGPNCYSNPTKPEKKGLDNRYQDTHLLTIQYCSISSSPPCCSNTSATAGGSHGCSFPFC